jgi:hypothetical protein
VYQRHGVSHLCQGTQAAQHHVQTAIRALPSIWSA